MGWESEHFKAGDGWVQAPGIYFLLLPFSQGLRRRGRGMRTKRGKAMDGEERRPEVRRKERQGGSQILLSTRTSGTALLRTRTSGTVFHSSGPLTCSLEPSYRGALTHKCPVSVLCQILCNRCGDGMIHICPNTRRGQSSRGL